MKQNLSAVVDHKVKEILEELAHKKRLRLSQFVAKILEEYIDRGGFRALTQEQAQTDTAKKYAMSEEEQEELNGLVDEVDDMASALFKKWNQFLQVRGKAQNLPFFTTIQTQTNRRPYWHRPNTGL